MIVMLLANWSTVCLELVASDAGLEVKVGLLEDLDEVGKELVPIGFHDEGLTSLTHGVLY
jgi:hypothetical protein